MQLKIKLKANSIKWQKFIILMFVRMNKQLPSLRKYQLHMKYYPINKKGKLMTHLIILLNPHQNKNLQQMGSQRDIELTNSIKPKMKKIMNPILIMMFISRKIENIRNQEEELTSILTFQSVFRRP